MARIKALDEGNIGVRARRSASTLERYCCQRADQVAKFCKRFFREPTGL